MTMSPQAALSIPINFEPDDPTVPGSPGSLNNIDIQSDDENDRELAEKRLSRYYPTTPVSVGAIIQPQFSCPDFAMRSARGMTGRMKEAAPPVPTISSIRIERESSGDKWSESTNTSPSGRVRVRKKNSFVQQDSAKRGWEDTFGEERIAPRKRHGMFLGRLQGSFLKSAHFDA